MQSKHNFRFPAAKLPDFTAWLTRQDIPWRKGRIAHVVLRVYTENGWREMFDDGSPAYPVSAHLVPIVRHYLRRNHA